jgi:hypothetical protein
MRQPSAVRGKPLFVLRRFFPKMLWSLLLVLSTGAVALAQTEAGSSAMEGLVVDTDANPVAAAKVTIQNLDTGYSRTLTTDQNGQYIALVMPVGNYAVSAEAAKGTARLEAIPLSVGTRKTVNLILTPELETIQEIYSTVQESLDREEAASGSSFGFRAVADLPIRGRNFPEFVKLVPAVQQESDRLGLVIAGQRAINSNVSIDGSDFNDPLQGNQRGGNESVFFFPQVAVREFQVIRSGLSVEVGRTSAGFVNVVTKSGNNNWHGEAFFMNRNRRLTSVDAFDNSLDNGQHQLGGSISGPVKRDRAFFFVGIEQNYLRVPFVVKFAPAPSGITVPAALRAVEGEHSGTNDPTALFARTDMVLNTRDTLNVSYAFSRQKGENFNRELGPEQAASTNFERTGESHGIRSSLTSVFSPQLVNEVRAQVATDDRQELPNLAAPQIVISGFGSIGGDTGRPRKFETTVYQLSDNFSRNFGKHETRLGADLKISELFQQRLANMQGRYDFKSLADYVAGKVDRFRQTLPGPNTGEPALNGTQKEVAVFLQDRIAIQRNLTVTAGIRWEGQWNPQPADPNPALVQTTRIPNDPAQWQPRLGLAWAPGGATHTVLRLSAGIFAARTPATLLQRIFTENGVATLLVDSKADRSVLDLLVFPDILTAIPSGSVLPAQNVVGIDSNFRNPRSFQTAATLEHKLPNGLTISAGYIHNSTWNLQRRLDRNLFAPTISATGMPIFPKVRPNPSIARFSINESSAHSRYQGLITTLIYPMGRRVSIQANYTLARTLDNDSNERGFTKEGALNPFDLSLEWTHSKQDVRHAFNLMSWADLPGKITFSTVLLARSGFPYTPIIGVDTQNDGNDFNDRAIINGRVAERNSLRESSFFNLDLRLVKAFAVAEGKHLDLMAEVFNATRALNKNYGPDSVSEFGTPSSPLPTAGLPLFAPGAGQFGGPRQLQLGIRFVF